MGGGAGGDILSYPDEPHRSGAAQTRNRARRLDLPDREARLRFLRGAQDVSGCQASVLPRVLLASYFTAQPPSVVDGEQVPNPSAGCGTSDTPVRPSCPLIKVAGKGFERFGGIEAFGYRGDPKAPVAHRWKGSVSD